MRPMNPMTRGRRRIWAATLVSTLAVLGGMAATPPAMADGLPRGHTEDRGHAEKRGHHDLGPAIEAIMHKPGYEHAQWGVLEIGPGERPGDPLPVRRTSSSSPGSTTKLVTISAAWHTLGPDHRFTTPVQAAGTPQRVDAAREPGAGRPGRPDHGRAHQARRLGGLHRHRPHRGQRLPGATLTPENPLAGIDQIARQVRAAGITRVDGDVDHRPAAVHAPGARPAAHAADHQRQPHRPADHPDHARAAPPS